MTKTTRAQREALAKLAARTEYGYRSVRESVQPTIGCDGAIVVPLWNMWIAIERDGYTHS
jgi:hypothetical protein